MIAIKLKNAIAEAIFRYCSMVHRKLNTKARVKSNVFSSNNLFKLSNRQLSEHRRSEPCRADVVGGHYKFEI